MFARAQEVADRCRALRVTRESLDKLHAKAELVYVVGRDEEFVYAPEGRLVAGEGLMKLKRLDGSAHPLVRSVAPQVGSTQTVFDGTLGLAQDALHLAVVAGLHVHGVDAHPALICLIENFLRRAHDRWGDAAHRIHARHAEAATVLKETDDNAYDVVYLDPMFDRAMPSQPDFRVLRRMARQAPVDAALLGEAFRVARQRVVLKVRTLATPDASPPGPGWNRRVSGRAFNYWIAEKALPHPELEPLRVKYSRQKLRFLGLLASE